MKKTLSIIMFLTLFFVIYNCSTPNGTDTEKDKIVNDPPNTEPSLTYSIFYNKNGATDGICPEDTNNYKKGDSITVSQKGTLQRFGHTFAFWNTKSDGSGISYVPGTILAMPQNDLTLFAQWTINKHFVIYLGGENTGGNVPSSKLYDFYSIITITESNLIKKSSEGIKMVFKGWNTKFDGTGKYYYANDTFRLYDKDITLYAQWEALLGEGPAGGLIFYDKGSYTDGWRYLEAAPSDQIGQISWAPENVDNPDFISIPGLKKASGDGKENTDIIVDKFDSDNYYAAKICYNLKINGFADWYLPSEVECIQMKNNLYKKGLGNFQYTSYWASNLISKKSASYMDLTENLNVIKDKLVLNNSAVRAVRRF